MPYKVDGSDVPESVASLSATKRRMFAAVWNSAYSKCVDDGGTDSECEGSAFAQANGVLKQQEVDMTKKKEVLIDAEELEQPASEVEPEPEPEPEQEVEPEQEAAPEAATPNPTSPADALPTDGGGVAPAIEESEFSKVRDLLQAALAIVNGMTQTEEPEMPGEPPMEAAELFTESAVLQLVEADPPANRRAPLMLDVGIIRVGPGNKCDNHYYTREMLERDGAVFGGAKMYATDHRNNEKSVRTEVSLVKEIRGVQEFADGAYLTGRVTVFNPDFAEDVRNRADAGVLDSLHCSILAKGEAQPGEVDGTEYNIVTHIAEAQSVDWVTRAGAGGHAMAIAENDAQPEEPEEAATEIQTEELDAGAPVPVTLSEDSEESGSGVLNNERTDYEHQIVTEEVVQPLAVDTVLGELGKTNLPAASVAALATAPYMELVEVQAAVTSEVARLKALGSGQPLGLAAAPAKPKPKTSQEIQADLQAVNRKWLGR